MPGMNWIASIALALGLLGGSAASAADEHYHVYLGTYTGAHSKGIYRARFDAAKGELGPPELVADLANASFMALHPSKPVLYSVSEISNANGRKVGLVAAYSIDPVTGMLKLLNREESGGAGPCHVTVDKTGAAVVVANYGGGSLASLPIEADGKLKSSATVIQHKGMSVDKQRQGEPHAHSVNFDPTNRFLYCADLGVDQVFIYKFDVTTQALTPNEPASAALAAGSGPRHLAFHPSGKFAYVINELASTITAFQVMTEGGALEPLATVSTLPAEGFDAPNSTAEVVVHPSGKFVYGSNRGHDSVAIFAVDEAKGTLTLVGHAKTGGKTPRNFNIDPAGRWLLAANQDSGTIVTFRIDGERGTLTPHGQPLTLEKPVCVKFYKAAPAPKEDAPRRSAD